MAQRESDKASWPDELLPPGVGPLNRLRRRLTAGRALRQSERQRNKALKARTKAARRKAKELRKRAATRGRSAPTEVQPLASRPTERPPEPSPAERAAAAVLPEVEAAPEPNETPEPLLPPPRPRSEAEGSTRVRLERELRRQVDRLQDELRGVRDQLLETREEAERRVRDLVDRARDEAERLTRDVAKSGGDDVERLRAEIAGLRKSMEAYRAEAEWRASEAVAAAEAARQADQAPAAGLVDLNEATFEDLRSLGFPVEDAIRVLAFREQIRRFVSVDQLDRVPELSGPARALAKPHLRV
jgi:DNA uptake protein ComE-like DNA-binding protein